MRTLGSVFIIVGGILLAGCGDPEHPEMLKRMSDSFVGSKQQYGRCEVEQKRFYYANEFSGSTTYHYVYVAECPTATVTTTIQGDKSSTPVSVVVPKQLTVEELREIQKSKALDKLTPEERALFLPSMN